MVRLGSVLLVLLTTSISQAADPSGWKAGVAVRVITPKGPMWLAGYASRNRPSEGTEQDLHVKALAIEDPRGQRVVLLTSDLIGISQSLADAVCEEVGKKTGLGRESILLTCSHTHCGPVVKNNLEDMYEMPAEESAKIAPYTRDLQAKMVAVIGEAIGKVKPAHLAVGKGIARFAVNRRNNKEAEVPGIQARGGSLSGPVDHDVPVLRVSDSEGKAMAVVFGYACHNTTLSFQRWCGDYAGYAQEYIEKQHPGCAAMFWTGCGADSNPLPRRTVELCRRYGKELSDSVEAVLEGTMTPITGQLSARYAEVDLPYDRLPGGEQIAAEMLSKNHALRKRAEKLRADLDKKGKIASSYTRYPVQVWRLGDQVLWVALGGEVVVDYALALKKMLARDKQTVWVAGYANDVMAYIASARVLKEGGYEGESAMIYYGLPTKWSSVVESLILTKADELARRCSLGLPE
ncbi:MAG: neutral/alkaline non-lysosomal ceramidase N-terminal domain-containing protein [Gemmataceae bacterium]